MKNIDWSPAVGSGANVKVWEKICTVGIAAYLTVPETLITSVPGFADTSGW
jgi:hypothetical protein